MLKAAWTETAPVMLSAQYSLDAREGQSANLTISATGSNFSWNIDGDLPSGLAFTSEGSSSAISGTPANGTAGKYSLSVTASNNGGSATADNVLFAAEIAITTESEKFAAVAGEEFSTMIRVDVKLDAHNTSYDKYTYLMEIFGLPEWLASDGPLESSGKLEAEYHYSFTLT